MYSHLSSIAVEQDQTVAMEEVLGRTGTSGLAGGDHLHFSIIVHNTFVNPVEWWDPDWIRNNITVKLEGLDR
jgi:murein DD-endopeptidase MepM/ murein hydrolase activator NlpD